MATAAPRRARALQVEAPAKAPVAPAGAKSKATPKMVKLAQDVLIANAVKNKGTRDEKKNKEALNKEMIAADVTRFDFTVELEGAFLACEAVIAEGVSEYIDVALLRTLVDDDTFMKIVGATKGKTKEFAGENILLKVTKEEKTPAALSVNKVK
jgi:hypothetical protein